VDSLKSVLSLCQPFKAQSPWLKDMPPDSIRSINLDPVFRAISKHLVKAGRRADDGFESVEEDEDSITGDFLLAIRRGWSKDEMVDQDSQCRCALRLKLLN
jgi:hypothetical protein